MQPTCTYRRAPETASLGWSDCRAGSWLGSAQAPSSSPRWWDVLQQEGLLAGHCPVSPGARCSEVSCWHGDTSCGKGQVPVRRWSSAAQSWWYLGSRQKQS